MGYGTSSNPFQPQSVDTSKQQKLYGGGNPFQASQPVCVAPQPKIQPNLSGYKSYGGGNPFQEAAQSDQPQSKLEPNLSGYKSPIPTAPTSPPSYSHVGGKLSTMELATSNVTFSPAGKTVVDVKPDYARIVEYEKVGGKGMHVETEYRVVKDSIEKPPEGYVYTDTGIKEYPSVGMEYNLKAKELPYDKFLREKTYTGKVSEKAAGFMFDPKGPAYERFAGSALGKAAGGLAYPYTFGSSYFQDVVQGTERTVKGVHEWKYDEPSGYFKWTQTDQPSPKHLLPAAMGTAGIAAMFHPAGRAVLIGLWGKSTVEDVVTAEDKASALGRVAGDIALFYGLKKLADSTKPTTKLKYDAETGVIETAKGSKGSVKASAGAFEANLKGGNKNVLVDADVGGRYRSMGVEKSGTSSAKGYYSADIGVKSDTLSRMAGADVYRMKSIQDVFGSMTGSKELSAGLDVSLGVQASKKGGLAGTVGLEKELLKTGQFKISEQFSGAKSGNVVSGTRNIIKFKGLEGFGEQPSEGSFNVVKFQSGGSAAQSAISKVAGEITKVVKTETAPKTRPFGLPSLKSSTETKPDAKVSLSFGVGLKTESKTGTRIMEAAATGEKSRSREKHGTLTPEVTVGKTKERVGLLSPTITSTRTSEKTVLRQMYKTVATPMPAIHIPNIVAPPTAFKFSSKPHDDSFAREKFFGSHLESFPKSLKMGIRASADWFSKTREEAITRKPAYHPAGARVQKRFEMIYERNPFFWSFPTAKRQRR